MKDVRPKVVSRWALACIFAIALGLHAWGIRKDLPYVPHIDEYPFVYGAVRIASTGDLNPKWFGHPGSTVIYPLAGIYRLRSIFTWGGPLRGRDRGISRRYDSNPGEFYLLGRCLSVFYGVMTVLLTYSLGREVFGVPVGLLGALLTTLWPLSVMHSQLVRTDSAGALFAVLSLWRCLRLHDRPTLRNQLLAGGAIGLGLASRYLLAALIPVLLLVDAIILRRGEPDSGTARQQWLRVAAGVVSIALTFLICTPYVLLDFPTAWKDLMLEAETRHLGADRLSFFGNLAWYTVRVIPGVLQWPQLTFGALGLAVLLVRRDPKQVLLVGFALLFLLTISFPSLHWSRWIIPLLPVLALLISHGLFTTAGWVSTGGSIRILVIAAGVLLISAKPAYDVFLVDLRDSSPSTRILAREWILENLPSGSLIAGEWYTAPLADTQLKFFEPSSLAARTLENYCQRGYRYLVASSAMYGRYLSERDQYPREVAFYERLFREGKLLQEFAPSWRRGGPTVRIYGIDCSSE